MSANQSTADAVADRALNVASRSVREGLPELGLRNYWYPTIASWRLGRKPRPVRVLGEDIVVYRDGGKLHALADRCAHRGAKLSMGKNLYPGSGTLSCPYHGWTYDGGTGRCVAKLVEGPDAAIPAAARVKPYAVREFAGVIWVFVGDMDAVPLEEDLPEYLALQDVWHSISNWRTYRCNWQLLADNLSHDQHAPFLHRTAPELLLQPVFSHATRNSTEPLDDGKGIAYRATGGIHTATYPGLGTFPPASEWYRLLKPTGRGQELDPNSSPAAVKYGIRFRHMSRLPSVHLIGRPSGDFFTCRWIVPVDANTTLLWNFNLFRRRGPLGVLADRVVWLLWKSWAHDWLFSDQDKWIAEGITRGPEVLSNTDVGVTAFRRFVSLNARQPAPTPRPAQPRTESEIRDDEAVL